MTCIDHHHSCFSRRDAAFTDSACREYKAFNAQSVFPIFRLCDAATLAKMSTGKPVMAQSRAVLLRVRCAESLSQPSDDARLGKVALLWLPLPPTEQRAECGARVKSGRRHARPRVEEGACTFLSSLPPPPRCPCRMAQSKRPAEEILSEASSLQRAAPRQRLSADDPSQGAPLLPESEIEIRCFTKAVWEMTDPNEAPALIARAMSLIQQNKAKNQLQGLTVDAQGKTKLFNQLVNQPHSGAGPSRTEISSSVQSSTVTPEEDMVSSQDESVVGE